MENKRNDTQAATNGKKLALKRETVLALRVRTSVRTGGNMCFASTCCPPPPAPLSTQC